MSFRLSFHLAPPGLTGAHWLDDPPDLSCKDSTRQYPVDVEHQPHNRRVAGSRPASPTEQVKEAMRELPMRWLPGHSVGHSTWHYSAPRERAGWTGHPT
jgi:hypothetical protein